MYKSCCRSIYIFMLVARQLESTRIVFAVYSVFRSRAATTATTAGFWVLQCSPLPPVKTRVLWGMHKPSEKLIKALLHNLDYSVNAIYFYSLEVFWRNRIFVKEVWLMLLWSLCLPSAASMHPHYWNQQTALLLDIYLLPADSILSSWYTCRLY